MPSKAEFFRCFNHLYTARRTTRVLNTCLNTCLKHVFQHVLYREGEVFFKGDFFAFCRVLCQRQRDFLAAVLEISSLDVGLHVQGGHMQ